jgi:predicted CXXCH cytochrome family protein
MFTTPGLLLVLLTTLGVLYGVGLVPAPQTGNGLAEISGSHSATTDCIQCHGNRPEQTSPDTVELIAPVPELCSTCHSEYASLDGWVHGPVATGDCRFCHDSHQSEHGSLLTKPMPELCYDCHTLETLRSIAGHSDKSFGSCNTCHESHAGTNRELLRQSLLDSMTGTLHSDKAAHRRPRYTLVDRRGSLIGLKGVRIIPAIERQDQLSRYGLTSELVKTEIERCLRQEGVAILSDDGQPTEAPGLYASLRLIEVRFPGYSDEICALSGTLDISLRQTVELVSQPGDTERRTCLATTWDTSAVVVWGVPQIQEGLNNAVEVLVARFCCDYRLANPSDEQPLSGRNTSERSESGSRN